MVLEKLHSRWGSRAIFPARFERINTSTRHVGGHLTRPRQILIKSHRQSRLQHGAYLNKDASYRQYKSFFLIRVGVRWVGGVVGSEFWAGGIRKKLGEKEGAGREEKLGGAKGVKSWVQGFHFTNRD